MGGFLLLCQWIVWHLLCSLMEDWFCSNSSCTIMSLLSSMAALNGREKPVIVWFSTLRFLVESNQYSIPSSLSCQKIKRRHNISVFMEHLFTLHLPLTSVISLIILDLDEVPSAFHLGTYFMTTANTFHSVALYYAIKERPLFV